MRFWINSNDQKAIRAPMNHELLPLDTMLVQDTGQDALAALTDRIATLMETRLEGLLSMLYRLDIDERKLKEALSVDQAESPARAVASLVLERHLQRMETRRQYPADEQQDFDCG